jgi:hypothetical protein
MISPNKIMRAFGLERGRARDLGRMVGAGIGANIAEIAGGTLTGEGAMGQAQNLARQFNFPPNILGDYVDFGKSVQFIGEQFNVLKKQIAFANLKEAIKDAGLFVTLGRTAANRIQEEVKGRLKANEAKSAELQKQLELAETDAERKRIAEEIAAIEKEKLSITEDMEKAEEQIQLLDFLREAGLNAAEVLGQDFKFGLDIDPESLFDATTKALNAIIQGVNANFLAAQGIDTSQTINPGDLGLPGGFVPQFASGGDFTVPGASGTPFPMIVHGGERVQVTPAGMAGSNTELHLHVSSPIPSAGLIQDFKMLQSMASA